MDSSGNERQEPLAREASSRSGTPAGPEPRRVAGEPTVLGEVGDPGATAPFPERPYDPEPARDTVRGQLALATVALLALIITLGFVLIGLRLATPADAKDFVTAVLTPVVALTGTVLGFYFGGKGAASPK
jgi:hypothetical protein